MVNMQIFLYMNLKSQMRGPEKLHSWILLYTKILEEYKKKKKKFTCVLFSCYANKLIHREYAEWSCVQQIPLLLHNDHEWIY